MNYFIVLLILLPLKVYALDFYQIKKTQHSQRTSSIKNSRNQIVKISTHHYKRNESKKLLTLIHGYTENCGYMKNIIELFLSQGFEVQCPELPGHGQSDGKKYDIDSFKTYELMAHQIIKELSPEKEHYFLAHSTGSVGFTQFLKNKNKNPFTKIILLAPLTKCKFWIMANAGFSLFSPFINDIKRFSYNRGKGYAWAKGHDPYLSNYEPLHWFKELIEYNNHLNDKVILDSNNILIVYGNQDEVIDWKDSKELHTNWFPKARIKTIENGSHHTYFNNKEIQKKLYQEIKDFL
jgi:alpha-beta hydrolase superfamily lysophospholipase